MECDLKITDRKKHGLPLWVCARAGCGNRCVSETGKCQTHCRSGEAVEITAQATKEVQAEPKTAGCKPCEASRKVKERIRELLEARKAGSMSELLKKQREEKNMPN